MRSRSLTNECRVPTIFKQKALTVPSDKSSHGKGSTKRRKDPLAIFDFYDDDENDNEIVELRSSITTDDQPGNDDDEPKVNEAHEGEDKSHGKTRRSTLIIVNNVPSDVLCRECQSQGTDANMTEYGHNHRSLSLSLSSSRFSSVVINANIFIISPVVCRRSRRFPNEETTGGRVIVVTIKVKANCRQVLLLHSRFRVPTGFPLDNTRSLPF